MVTNNYRDVSSSVLKSQHIQRRKSSLVVQGVPAIKGIESIKQNPVRRKRPAPLKLPEIRRNEPVPEESVKKPLSVVKTIKFSPNILLMIFCLLVVAFFSYYALLWKDEKIDIKPNIDAQIRKRMLEYAAGNSLAIKLPSETPPGNAETFSWLNYTIKKGDSVSKIAADHSLSMDAVIASNNMTNARSLREGEIIRIPNMDGIPYTVKKGDSLKKISENFAVPLEAILDANDIQDDNINAGTVMFIPGAKMRPDDLKMAMGNMFTYPVIGRLTSSYGWRKDPFTGLRRYHRAIDLSSPTGTPVSAAMGGRVSTIGYSDAYGNYIIITHSSGFQTMYAHLSKTSVKEGAQAAQGDKIGEVGNTGYSTGPHLHFAVYKNGKSVNPLEYLKF